MPMFPMFFLSSAFESACIFFKILMRPVALGAYGGFLILPINMIIVAPQKIEIATHDLLCAFYVLAEHYGGLCAIFLIKGKKS
jgi:hypothetical protein